MTSLTSYFNDIDDPRSGNAPRHKFCDLMTISLLCVLRELIEMFDICGITITADALHCQRETCELIVQEGGDYCLQLKGNQGNMLADVQAFVEDQNTDFIDEYTATDAGHGRIEERVYRVYDVPNYLVERRISGAALNRADYSTPKRGPYQPLDSDQARPVLHLNDTNRS